MSERAADVTIEYGQITVKDNGVEVIDAPTHSLITLELIAAADPRVMQIRHGQITFRGGISYNVIGWDADLGCLQVERDDA